MIRKTYAELLANAESRIAAGFGTKTAKEYTLALVSNAYDLVRESFRIIGRAEADAAGRDWYKMPDAWRHVMDSMPYSVAHWNAKRAAVLEAYPAIVAQANECAAMRARIAAVPVVKVARERTASERAADAAARTCQICGRPIFAETGLIAHHGYERPGEGWQTASCYGARHLPFEADSAVLRVCIAQAKGLLERMEDGRARIADKSGPVTRSYDPGRHRAPVRVAFTAETIAYALWFAPDAFSRFGTMSGGRLSLYWDHRDPDVLYAECLRIELQSRDARIQQQREYITMQEARLASWVQREKWNATTQKWESV